MLEDRPDARGGDDDARGGEFAVDAAVAPVRVLLREAEYQGGGPFRDSRSTWPGVRVGPVLGDEIALPTQQGCRLDEEVSESTTGEQSCQSGQHRSICWFQRRAVHLALEDRHLMTQDHDLDREVCISATDEADQLEDAPERPVEEREGHGRMLAAPGVSRQSPAHTRWMTFSARTGTVQVVSAQRRNNAP